MSNFHALTCITPIAKLLGNVPERSPIIHAFNTKLIAACYI